MMSRLSFNLKKSEIQIPKFETPILPPILDKVRTNSKFQYLISNSFKFFIFIIQILFRFSYFVLRICFVVSYRYGFSHSIFYIRLRNNHRQFFECRDFEIQHGRVDSEGQVCLLFLREAAVLVSDVSSAELHRPPRKVRKLQKQNILAVSSCRAIHRSFVSRCLFTWEFNSQVLFPRIPLG